MKKSISNLCRAITIFAILALNPFPSQALEVAFERDSSLPIVYLNIATKVGSSSDPSGQFGLTNFMGEMLLRGTRSRTKEQIDLALDQMGAKLEVEARSEALIFRGAVLSSQLESYLNLVTEILTQPSFPEKEIKKLKSEITSVIQEELGHDSSLASRKYNAFLFRNHPYGKPILGKTKDIENLSLEQISSHYNRLFRSESLLVVGTGDASSDQITNWSENLVRNRSMTELTLEDKKVLERATLPENSSRRRVLIVDKPDRTQTQIYAGQIGIRMTDREFFPLYLGNYAFGGPSFSAKLMTEIRVKRGWSYGANSSFKHGLQPRSWTLHLYPAEKDTASALNYSLKLVDDLKQEGITETQFEFAKRSLMNSSGFMYNTPKKRVENKLLEKTLALPDGFIQSFGPELQKVKLTDVNKALRDFVKPDHLAITVLGTAQNLKASLLNATGISEDQLEIISYTAE